MPTATTTMTVLPPRSSRRSRGGVGWTRTVILAGALSLGAAVRAADRPPPSPESAETDELLRLGRNLFEQLAPEEVKARFEFPSKESWDEFAARLQRAREGDSLAELAAFAPEARAALAALRTLTDYLDLADWLEQRLDEIEGARLALPPPKPTGPSPVLRPDEPRATPPPPVVQPVPHYNLWKARVEGRAPPAGAAALMPTLRAAFIAEGTPPELVWLAEAESSFNPLARSPVGARGLFQFMPETARSMGLSTSLPDERTDPEKSARAAARYLRMLHGKFGNWALALAAYNAGEGRVARTLAAHRATTYSAIADALPAETRMYVPKVCALIATRAGVSPHQIAPPRR